MSEEGALSLYESPVISIWEGFPEWERQRQVKKMSRSAFTGYTSIATIRQSTISCHAEKIPEAREAGREAGDENIKNLLPLKFTSLFPKAHLPLAAL